MNTIVWISTLLLLGLATGRITGALLAFTRGRTIHDLAAGLLGAVAAGMLLRLAGPSAYRAALPTLLAGVGAAILATWLTRIVMWPPEPVLRPANDPASSNALQSHNIMTTSEGTRFVLGGGKLARVGARRIPS